MRIKEMVPKNKTPPSEVLGIITLFIVVGLVVWRMATAL